MADFTDQELAKAAAQLQQQKQTQGPFPQMTPLLQNPQTALTPGELDKAIQQLDQKSAEGNSPATGRANDWLDELIRKAGGVGVGTPAYPDFKNLKIGSSGQKFVDPSDDPNYEARRQFLIKTLAGQGALTGGLAAGMPALAAGLGGAFAGATANTPGDVASSAVTSAFPTANLTNRFLNTGANMLLGGLRAKTGEYARALTDQTDLPSTSNFGIDANTLAGAGLGAVSGLAGKPQPEKPPEPDSLADWRKNGQVANGNLAQAQFEKSQATSARKLAKTSTGKAYGELNAAQAAHDSDKAAVQKQAEDALADLQDKAKNAKVVGAQDFYNNEVAKAQTALADLQNKDWTQSSSYQRLTQAQQAYNDAVQNSKGTISAKDIAEQKVALARKAQADWRNSKPIVPPKPAPTPPNVGEQFLDALIHKGTGALAGGILGGLHGHGNPLEMFGIGPVVGMGTQAFVNSPTGQKIMSNAPSAIPGMSNLIGNQ